MDGLDILGAAKFSKEALRACETQGFGIFWDIFGDSSQVFQKLRNVKFCRVQLLYRKDHDFRESFDEIEDYALALKKLIAEIKPKYYEEGLLFVSGACEHKLDTPSAQKLVGMLARIDPKWRIINTPLVKEGAFLKDVINEVHGSDGRPVGQPYAFSYDGKNCVDDNVPLRLRYHKAAFYRLLWHPSFNGKFTDKPEEQTPIPERVGWPSPELVNSVSYLFQKRRGEGAPKLWLKKGALCKSHAEGGAHIPPERQGRPVLLYSTKAKEVVLKNARGGVLARSSENLPYIDVRTRFYFSEWGYELAEKAGKSRVAYLYDRKELIGVINPAFRFGGFR